MAQRAVTRADALHFWRKISRRLAGVLFNVTRCYLDSKYPPFTSQDAKKYKGFPEKPSMKKNGKKFLRKKCQSGKIPIENYNVISSCHIPPVPYMQERSDVPLLPGTAVCFHKM